MSSRIRAWTLTFDEVLRLFDEDIANIARCASSVIRDFS